MAQLHARGSLRLETDFVNESFFGSKFTGRLLAETSVGDVSAVVPRISGRAWVTGTAQYSLDPGDAFPVGFL
jgi:proline racemase